MSSPQPSLLPEIRAALDALERQLDELDALYPLEPELHVQRPDLRLVASGDERERSEDA